MATAADVISAVVVGGSLRGVLVPQAVSRGSIKRANRVRIAKRVKNG